MPTTEQQLVEEVRALRAQLTHPHSPRHAPRLAEVRNP
jgi:hypothetical protein